MMKKVGIMQISMMIGCCCEKRKIGLLIEGLFLPMELDRKNLVRF